MITKWGVKNFKSILEADLDLAPLTVFTGVNSSGKSSFLQSIVMLAQSEKSKEKLINIKGDLIDLGSFYRIYCQKAKYEGNKPADEINVNFIIPDDEYEHIYYELEMSGRDHDFLSTSPDSEKLFIHKINMECKKKKSDKDTLYFKCKEYGHYFNDTTKSISDSYDKMYRKIINDTDNNTDNDSAYGQINDNIDIDIRNVLIASFLPIFILYKPCNLHYSDYSELINEFSKLLSDIPGEILATKEDAENYILQKSLNVWFNKKYFNEIVEYDSIKQIFYICANNLWWRESFYLDENGNDKAIFIKIPYFEEIFSKFKKNYDTGSEYYDIELSDWFQVLSNQEIHIQEAIKKELKKDTEFTTNLINSIDNFKKLASFLLLSQPINHSIAHLRDYFKNKIYYLGPLREDPKWECNLKDEYLEKMKDESTFEYEQRMRDVGVKGEKTPFVINHLHNNQDPIEKYYSPDFFKPDYKPSEKPVFFSDGFKEWLNYIGLSDEFKKRELEKDKRFSVNMIIKGQEFAIPQLGTGVSQVVPILVRCLSAPVGSTIIIEQPELHLHPKMQSRLADFFIAMALSDRQCLIETHSEYLIYMLRYRISHALRKNDESIQKAIKILYAEKENEETKFHEIKINRHGELSAWPDGFFDERQKQSDIMLEEILSEEDI